MKPRQRIDVGVVGATGLVGQRLVSRLEGHPWFALRVLAASERSTGRSYGDAVDWRLPGRVPAYAADLEVRPATPAALADCRLVFSSLDPASARPLEGALVDSGLPVVSNSSAFRMDGAVPLLVPEVNASHLDLLSRRRTGAGFIVTNSNCSVIGLALVLGPLHRAFGVRRVVVTTMQAVSGAGIDGPRAMELIDNIVPFIPREEEKMETELRKILGTCTAGGIQEADIAVSAHCHRVPTQDGHLECASVELGSSASPTDVQRVLEEFESEIADLGLPAAPARPVIVDLRPDRPQPRLDRDTGGGMSVVVGRLRACSVLGIKLELLSHNTVRGAAGGTLLVAELLAARGFLEEEPRP